MADMKAVDAANAYGAALNRAGGSGLDGAGAAGQAAGGESGFASMVESLVDETKQSVAAAETASMNAVTGEADLVDVVTAVSNAETALESVTAVRDRVISAYQEIMNMPI